MKPVGCITTSWDDGHPLDLRLAELLTKYGLRGTFYVPMTAEHGTMTSAQVRTLGGVFEIGAHTLHHVDLSRATEKQARQEIADSQSWVEDVVGRPCRLFCPPKGRYSARHLHMVRQAGFAGVRTVELLSLDLPRFQAGLFVLPTTVQAHPHGRLAYGRNAIRRGAFRNLWRYAVRGFPIDWTGLARSLLNRVLECGGVFHLWGHSWELEQTGQWRRLEEVLRFLGEFTGEAPARTNGEVCRAADGINKDRYSAMCDPPLERRPVA
ncbi:MAG TPA: polysaccharide deacetylase family protein [Gemmataceae bacterium]|nr:polysaccharide deacetylase family protein [Gemmataceae bacterium]